LAPLLCLSLSCWRRKAFKKGLSLPFAGGAEKAETLSLRGRQAVVLHSKAQLGNVAMTDSQVLLPE